VTAVTVSGGLRDNALQLLQLHLRDAAWAWLNNLALGSIGLWEHFWKIFIANFRGTSRRPMSFKELRLCVQKNGETLRLYISRWLSLHNTAKKISPERAISAFRDALVRKDVRETLGRTKPKTINHLTSLANEWADGEDSIQNPRNNHRSPDEGYNMKDQHYSGARRVRQRGRQNRYTNTDLDDMVPAGYTNNENDDNHDGPRHGNTYYERSSQSVGHDTRPKIEW
jgi:hypothetical protein